MIETIRVAFRLARRELRRGLSGFRIFLACLILGVASIAGVGSLSEALLNGLSLQGRELLGGDVELRLTQREATEEERAWLDAHGRLSMTAELRAMAIAQGKDAHALVELKAVDAPRYPLYGAADVSPRQPLFEAFANRQGVFGAAVDRSLYARLGVSEGSIVKIGNALFELRATLKNEPDRVAGGFTLGPRVMISEFALRATGLVQPGSLVNFNYRVALPPGKDSRKDVVAWLKAVDVAFPEAGWQARDRWNAAPGVRRFIEQVGAFLILIGLTALVVGGVGIANAVRTYLDRRRDDIATLKCLGASGGFIFVMFLTEIMALSAVGVAIGLVLGVALPFFVGSIVGDQIPFDADFDFYWRPVVSAAAFGVLTTFAFAIWPLARAREISPAGMFRMLVAPQQSWPRLPYILLTLLAFALLIGLGLWLTPNLRLAGGFALGVVLTFALLNLTAAVMMRVAKNMPRPRNTMARLALANIYRPGAPTPAVILSLGLGLTLLAAIALIDNNLRHRMADEIPKESPSFFFVDIQSAQVDPFETLLKSIRGVSDIELVPMLRGRIVKLNATPADKARVARDVRWALSGDRGITYGNPPGARDTVVKGDWWPADYKGPPLVSFSQTLADGMGLKIGDTMTVNILGREFTMRIANLRRVDFSNARMNFIMVVSPGVLEGAPHAYLATARATPDQDDAVEKAVVAKFPNISVIRVREVLATANMVLDQIAVGVRSASLVTLITGLLVLAGALAAGHRFRLYDAVVMKVLGATRRQVLTTYLLEFAVLGAGAGLIAAIAGSLAAWAVAIYVMEIKFVLDLATLLLIVVGGAFAAMVLGIGSTWGALRAPAASTLRTV
jgi:putative ABC transport system permease protein